MPLRRQEAAIGGVEIFDEKDDAASALAHDGKKIDKISQFTIFDKKDMI